MKEPEIDPALVIHHDPEFPDKEIPAWLVVVSVVCGFLSLILMGVSL